MVLSTRCHNSCDCLKREEGEEYIGQENKWVSEITEHFGISHCPRGCLGRYGGRMGKFQKLQSCRVFSSLDRVYWAREAMADIVCWERNDVKHIQCVITEASTSNCGLFAVHNHDPPAPGRRDLASEGFHRFLFYFLVAFEFGGVGIASTCRRSSPCLLYSSWPLPPLLCQRHRVFREKSRGVSAEKHYVWSTGSMWGNLLSSLSHCTKHYNSAGVSTKEALNREASSDILINSPSSVNFLGLLWLFDGWEDVWGILWIAQECFWWWFSMGNWRKKWQNFWWNKARLTSTRLSSWLETSTHWDLLGQLFSSQADKKKEVSSVTVVF